jgi:hypothetical protein
VRRRFDRWCAPHGLDERVVGRQDEQRRTVGAGGVQADQPFHRADGVDDQRPGQPQRGPRPLGGRRLGGAGHRIVRGAWHRSSSDLVVRLT